MGFDRSGGRIAGRRAMYGEETEYLRVFIKQLRKKIESDPAEPKFLLTEPWVGYRLQLVKTAS